MTAESKPTWRDVPEPLKAAIANVLGAPVKKADVVWGGFGPSATFVLTTANATRFFCKGTHPGQTPEGHAALKRERKNLERFPEIAAFGPRYLGGADHGDWHVAILEHLRKARDVPPWSDDAVTAVIDLMARFYAASPERAPREMPRIEEAVGFNLFRAEQGWGSLTREPEQAACFAALFADPAAASAWLDRHGEQLAQLESRAETMGGPQSWLHLDLRSDNLVFSGDTVRLVDWPFLAFGPTLIDVAFFLPSLAGEGGPRCDDALYRFELASGSNFAPDDVTLAVAAVSGFFAARAGLPEVPLLPRLRWIQKLQLFPALDWMADCAGIARPPAYKPFSA